MDLKETEKIFKALANKRRLAIIRLLKNKKELTVGEIAKEIKLSFKSTSRHLYVLYGAELLEKEQRGLQMFYSVNKNLAKNLSVIISVL